MMGDERELRDVWLTELAGGELAGDELREALAARTASAVEVERALREIEVARRVRALMFRLREAEVEVPADFELRVLERVRADQTLLEMLELYLSGFGAVLVELLNALFSFLPAAAQEQPVAA